MPEKAESPSRPPLNSEVEKRLDLALAFLEEGRSLARNAGLREALQSR